MMSMQMLQPTAELRISNDIFRESNADALEAIWQLVDGMYYGDDEARLLWGETAEELDMPDASGRSHSSAMSMPSSMPKLAARRRATAAG